MTARLVLGLLMTPTLAAAAQPSEDPCALKLGETSGIEVLLHPDVKEEKISGELGPMAGREGLAGAPAPGTLLTRFDGERLLIAKAPGRPQPLGKHRVPTFDCPAR